MQNISSYQKFKKMKIKYFQDTDTALVELTEDKSVIETREISENVYIDFDKKGNAVSITLEHARSTAHLPDLIFQQYDKNTAKPRAGSAL